MYHNHECCLLVCASFWPDVRARKVALVEVRVSTLTWHLPTQLSTLFAFWVQRRLTKSSTGFMFALYYRLFTFRCCVDYIAIVTHSVCPLPHQREAPGLPVLCEAARWLLCDACGRGGGRQVSSVNIPWSIFTTAIHLFILHVLMLLYSGIFQEWTFTVPNRQISARKILYVYHRSLLILQAFSLTLM